MYSTYQYSTTPVSNIFLRKLQQLNTVDEFRELLNEVLQTFKIHGNIQTKHFEHIASPEYIRDAYYFFTIQQKKTKFRLIQSPSPELKVIQKAISLLLQSVYSPNPAAQGFVWGKSIIDNATIHTQQAFVYNLDLKDFFSEINASKAMQALKQEPISLQEDKQWIKELFCSLCFVPYTSTNLADTIPPLEFWVLPQGAPSSPVFSNIVSQQMDEKMTILADKFDAKYSRYVDDITFSANKPLFKSKTLFRKELTQILEQEGFDINWSKHSIRVQTQQQQVTGLVVNQKVNIRRKYKKDIRKWLYLWEQYGYEKAQSIFLKNYRETQAYLPPKYPELSQILKGKINFVKTVKGRDNQTYCLLNNRLEVLLQANCTKEEHNQATTKERKNKRSPYRQLLAASNTSDNIVEQVGKPDETKNEVDLVYYDYQYTFKENEVVYSFPMASTIPGEYIEVSVSEEFEDRILGWRVLSQEEVAAIDSNMLAKLPVANDFKSTKQNLELAQSLALSNGSLLKRTVVRADKQRRIFWNNKKTTTISDTINKIRQAQPSRENTIVLTRVEVITSGKFKGRTALRLHTKSIMSLVASGNPERTLALRDFIEEYLSYNKTEAMLVSAFRDMLRAKVEELNNDKSYKGAKIKLKSDTQLDKFATNLLRINWSKSTWIQINAPKLNPVNSNVSTISSINNKLNKIKYPQIDGFSYGMFGDLSVSQTLQYLDEDGVIGVVSYTGHRLFNDALNYLNKNKTHTATHKKIKDGTHKTLKPESQKTGNDIVTIIEQLAEQLEAQGLHKLLTDTTNVGESVATSGDIKEVPNRVIISGGKGTRKLVDTKEYDSLFAGMLSDPASSAEFERLIGDGWQVVRIGEGVSEQRGFYQLRKTYQVPISGDSEGQVEVLLTKVFHADKGFYESSTPFTVKIFKLNNPNEARNYGTPIKGGKFKTGNIIYNQFGQPEVMNSIDFDLPTGNEGSLEDYVVEQLIGLVNAGELKSIKVRGQLDEALYQFSRKNQKVKTRHTMPDGSPIFAGLRQTPDGRAFSLKNIHPSDFMLYRKVQIIDAETDKPRMIWKELTEEESRDIDLNLKVDILENILDNINQPNSNDVEYYENIEKQSVDNLLTNTNSGESVTAQEQVHKFMQNKSTNVSEVQEGYVILSEGSVIKTTKMQDEFAAAVKELDDADIKAEKEANLRKIDPAYDVDSSELSELDKEYRKFFQENPDTGEYFTFENGTYNLDMVKYLQLQISNPTLYQKIKDFGDEVSPEIENLLEYLLNLQPDEVDSSSAPETTEEYLARRNDDIFARREWFDLDEDGGTNHTFVRLEDYIVEGLDEVSKAKYEEDLAYEESLTSNDTEALETEFNDLTDENLSNGFNAIDTIPSSDTKNAADDGEISKT